MTTAGAAARVPLLEWWPRVAAAVAQAPGGLRVSVGQCFEDRDSPGQYGDGSAAEASRNDGTHRRQRRYGGRLWRRKGM
jgi:hypothetical protein